MESGDKQLAQIQKKLEKEEMNLGLAAKIVELESQVSQVKSRIGQLEDKKSTGQPESNLLQLDSEINISQTKKSKKNQKKDKVVKKKVEKKHQEEETEEENSEARFDDTDEQKDEVEE